MDLQKATFGNGCFWCTEAIFQMLEGVISVKSGFMGGHVLNPTYMEISNAKTGHAEVINIEFDAEIISFNELLSVFFKTHNPTLLNRQGNDVGTQYRSVVFYHSAEQQEQSLLMIKQLADNGVYEKPIVTAVEPAAIFHKADDHHQNYFRNNSLKPYCAVIIQPKINKFVQHFVEKIKPEFLH